MCAIRTHVCGKDRPTDPCVAYGEFVSFVILILQPLWCYAHCCDFHKFSQTFELLVISYRYHIASSKRFVEYSK